MAAAIISPARNDADRSVCVAFGGASIEISSNWRQVLDHAVTSFGPVSTPGGAAQFRIAITVDERLRSLPPWPRPYFRGRDRIVFASYASDTAWIIDIRRRAAQMRCSAAFAADAHQWRHTIFPVMIGVMSAPLGITPLHAACVVSQGCGLLLTGASGAGKSTLAVALTRHGWGLLSDDWTYLSVSREMPETWGLPVDVKLMPDAAAFFPQLSRLRPQIALNGEVGYEFDPQQVLDCRRVYRCSPGAIVVLDRVAHSTFDPQRIPGEQAARELTSMLEELPPSLAQYRAPQVGAVAMLVERPCWKLRCGGSPDEIAGAISRWWAEGGWK